MFALSVEPILFTLFGNPFPESAVARVVLGDNAVTILLLKLQQLFIPIIPISPIPNLPNKSHFIQLGFPVLRHQIRLPIHLRLPLPTLIRHPFSQLGILRVQTRNPNIPVFILVLHKGVKVLLPKRVPPNVPLKVDRVQHGNTIRIQKRGRGLILLVELEVLPLRLDPVVKQTVARVVVGNIQITPLRLVQQQLVEHDVPTLLPSAEIAREGGGGLCTVGGSSSIRNGTSTTGTSTNGTGTSTHIQETAAGWFGRIFGRIGRGFGGGLGGGESHEHTIVTKAADAMDVAVSPHPHAAHHAHAHAHRPGRIIPQHGR
mmetsp:Transcript_33827/g.64407  ORF Transcript_33827/g.64407 Transcript_33827/m.64407 type:complete len:316 (+) Transcript_33827:666-1613(+)